MEQQFSLANELSEGCRDHLYNGSKNFLLLMLLTKKIRFFSLYLEFYFFPIPHLKRRKNE